MSGVLTSEIKNSLRLDEEHLMDGCVRTHDIRSLRKAPLIANSGQRELSRVEKRLSIILYLIANSGQRELCTESVKNV